MISLANRFHGHNSLRIPYQKGKSVYSGNLKLIYLDGAKKNYRVAVVVSKKVHKSAVVRNRIRRRIYEQVRLYMQNNSTLTDFIFVAQSDKLAHMSAKDLNDETLQLLNKSTTSL
ncbi:MAG: ribonuclease P protein component [bacterium]